MLRALIFILLPFSVIGCLPEEDTEDIVNDQGQKVADPTLRMNGLWDGQLDQAGYFRVLIYNGNVFGFSDQRGYYGTVTLDSETDNAVMPSTSYVYSSADETALQWTASGSEDDVEFSGLLFTEQRTDDRIVGDYETDLTAGAFELTNDGTWENNSSLAAIEGAWEAPGYELYLSQVDEEISFREVQITTSQIGCTGRGSIRLIDEDKALYSVQLVERKHCTDFNVTNAPGFAVVNADGALEFFMKKDEALMFSRFVRQPETEDTAETPTE